MFENKFAKEGNQSSIQEKFIVIYDKLTKPVAISLRNSINDKYACAIWDKKCYEGNEAKLTSQNHLIFLNEELVDSNLANPRLKQVKYINGIIMIVEGNSLGFKYDPISSPGKLTDILVGSWENYLLRKLIPVFPLFPTLPVLLQPFLAAYLLISEKNKIKLKLFFDAIDKFKKESLELFLNGKLD